MISAEDAAYSSQLVNHIAYDVILFRAFSARADCLHSTRPGGPGYHISRLRRCLLI